MAQRPKPHVRAAILAAAARELAELGYERATLGAIARRAGTSIGNLYKYFNDKEALFAATIPSSLVERLKRLVRARVRALGGERDAVGLGPRHPYRLASEELFRFSLGHRFELLFLLQHAAGTPHASFPVELERELVARALSYAREAYPAFRATRARRHSLGRIYRSFLGSLAAILDEEEPEASAREATDELVTYHLAGLRAFFRADGSTESS